MIRVGQQVGQAAVAELLSQLGALLFLLDLMLVEAQEHLHTATELLDSKVLLKD